MNIRNSLAVCLMILALWSCGSFQNSRESGNEKAQFSINPLPRNIYVEGGNFSCAGCCC